MENKIKIYGILHLKKDSLFNSNWPFFKILHDIDYIAHTKSKVAAIQIYSFISSENMF